MPMQRTRNSGATFPHDELAALAGDVQRLSRLLTRDRESLPSAYLKDAGLRKAYLLYFLPSNIRKISVPLRELSLHPQGLLAKERLRVLDVGSGPGTAVLGLLDFYSRREGSPFFECTAVDHVAENLREAEALFREHRDRSAGKASLRTQVSGIEGLADRLNDQYDLIIFSNVLNELFHGEDDRRAKRVRTVGGILRRALAAHGSCIIIEPALRETSREMLMVRDGLLDEGFHVYSPCLIDGRCPALVNPRDWCHEDVPWDPPEIVREVDRRIGLRKDSLKFSYAVIRKDALSLSDIAGGGAFRVVSEPLVSKGKVEFYLCGPGGRRLVTRLERDGTAANEAFGRLQRGDIVRFEGLVDEGKRHRTGKETRVERLPFSRPETAR